MYKQCANKVSIVSFSDTVTSYNAYCNSKYFTRLLLHLLQTINSCKLLTLHTKQETSYCKFFKIYENTTFQNCQQFTNYQLQFGTTTKSSDNAKIQ